jgi:adenylate kinase family enzyme
LYLTYGDATTEGGAVLARISGEKTRLSVVHALDRTAGYVNRVAIIGSGGAGKSTIARQLGVILQLPTIHLDREYWQPGWVMTEREARVRLEAQMVAAERWLIDGNYGSTMDVRLAAADTVLFLDLHPVRCLWRVIMRGLRWRGRTRSDMAPGCPERLPGWDFLTWIATYRRRQRPHIKQLLDQLPSTTGVHVLSSPRQIRRFIQRVRLETSLGKAALTAALNEVERFA